MWSPIVLCFLVGFAFAANNPGWKEGAEYVYKIQGRSLVSHKEISNQQAGFLFRLTLRIQPQTDGKLRAQITRPEYDEIHSDLPEWNAHIPEDQLSWKPLKMSGKPFEVEMKGSRIVGLFVSKKTPVWEVNMIKSCMSQFQINTNGANLIENRLNTLPENGDFDNDAVFMTMEDTITGNTETMYQIRPLSDHLVQADFKEAQYLDAAEHGNVIEVIKNKNYANNVELPAYSFGFEGLQWGKPATNQMGEFFVRESTSRAILTGTLEHFVIRKSSTVNQIFVSPTMSDQKSSVAASFVNATLEKVTSQDEKIAEVPQPIHLQTLVYSYEDSFAQTNEIHARSTYQYRQEDNENEDYENTRTNWIRSPRSLRRYENENQNDNQNQKHGYKQELSELKEAPESPLLPFTMGYEGMSIKNKINVVQEVQKLAKEIGKRMQEEAKDHHEELLDMFTTMVSLVRIMDVEEVQQAAKDLYSNSKDGLACAIWVAFRDAVAQSGTGPALLVIKEWIETDKIEGEESSQVVSTMIPNVRQPTVQYFRTLFELVKQPKVEQQWPLNDTILMAFTDLIRRVYVDEHALKNNFPVKSFVPFRTDEGEQFIKEEVFRYFEQKLNEAIERSETHKIHALITSIGNTGSYYVLPIFEPFLEGKKQASQFQRVLMIMAMKKLGDNHRDTANKVLFRIYQNRAEAREVRIATVYQIMRTVPSTEMLKAMARYTIVDPDNYVNAAVKSSIENAAKLERPDFIEFRRAAQAAKPYLTEQLFGLHYGANYLRNFFIEELEKTYKQTIQTFGSDESMVPKGIYYSLREQMAGIQYRIATVQFYISRVDDLLQVTREQTAKFQRQQKQQREHSQEQEQNQWSSQNIAKLLNLQPEDKEQLEGFLSIELGNYQKMFAFDNRTVQDFSEVVREWEEKLKTEKEVSYFKLTTREIALSFPTETGVPFLFTYDVPTFMKAQGKVSAKVQPQLSQDGEIQTPEQIELNADMGITVSSKVQSRLSVTAPFNHKQYFAGFDKHLQVNVPARVQVQVDVKKMNAEIEIELKPTKEHTLLHYLTRPYTSKVDVTNFEPMTAQGETKLIKQDDLQAFESTVGKKPTGFAFRVELVHSRQFLDALRLGRILNQQQNIFDSLRSIWDDNSIQYGKFNVAYRPQESSARKVILRLSYDQQYKSQPESGSSSEWILNENAEPSQRQQELMKKIAADIKNVQVVSLDSSLEFEGDQKVKYILTGAVAKSNVDPKSRVMISYKRSSNGTPKPHEVHVVAKSFIPNTNALDFEYTLQNEPMAETEIKIKFGNSHEALSKIDAQLKYRRSAERKQYLKELPMHKQCKEEARAGNKQLPACLNMTMIANLLDSVDLKAHHENLKPELLETLQRYFKTLQVLAQPGLKIINKDTSLAENEIKMQARFHPDLQAVNITVKSQKQESRFNNIEVDEISQQIFVVHPVFHAYQRLSRHILAPMDNYRASCVVDKTHINTFSNLTYPADISKHWTVMLQYISGNSERHQQSIQEQLKSQLDNYVVLVRESPEAANKKDIKIVVSAPETDYKVVEIELTPSQGSNEFKAKVTVDGQEVKVSEKESHDIKGRFVQIYSLANGEVKVEIQRGFYVIYDGSRARISTDGGKLMNSIVGICGQFTEHKADELTTSQACVARDFEEFVKSYEVEGQQGKQIRDIFHGKTNKCVEKDIPLYVEVVVGRDYRSQKQGEQSNTCTYFQTKYVEQNGQTCFSIRAQPACSSHCQPRKQTTKNVQVHCVKQDSNVAELWKREIDNQRTGPDFSTHKVHKSIQMNLPESCAQ